MRKVKQKAQRFNDCTVKFKIPTHTPGGNESTCTAQINTKLL